MKSITIPRRIYNVYDDKDSENGKLTEAEKKEIITDEIGAHYLNMVNHVYWRCTIIN